MSIIIELTDLANLQNQTTAVNSINSNNETIEAGFATALNTAGDTMLGNLNMNGFQILNSGATSYTVATLPASPITGQQATVTDGVANASWGSTVAGGASTKYLVWFNGSAWTVIGK